MKLYSILIAVFIALIALETVDGTENLVGSVATKLHCYFGNGVTEYTTKACEPTVLNCKTVKDVDGKMQYDCGEFEEKDHGCTIDDDVETCYCSSETCNARASASRSLAGQLLIGALISMVMLAHVL